MSRQIIFQQEDYLSHQWEFLSSFNKTTGLVGGLGSGKTISFLSKTMISLLTRPGNNGKANIGIGYPTHELGKNLFYYPFCDMLVDAQIPFTANLTGLYITTPYGKVSIKSMQTPERIVGETFTDGGCDEIDTLPKPKGMLFVRKFRERLRGRKDSQLYLVSSPEGFSTCYEILQQNPNPDTKLIKAKTTDNYHLSKGYVADIMATYDERMAMAYINGEFVNLNAMCAHYAFDRKLHVQPVPKPAHEIPLFIGIDFNVHPMTATVGYITTESGVDYFNIFDEYYLHNSNTYMLADLIAEDYPDRIITCYPDPTGESRKTSSDISDLEILKRKGFEVRFRHNIAQRRSLNYANGALSHNRVRIDPSCKHLIQDLEQVTTDSFGQIEKPTGTMLTHISDAMRNVIAVHTILKQKQYGRVA